MFSIQLTLLPCLSMNKACPSRLCKLNVEYLRHVLFTLPDPVSLTPPTCAKDVIGQDSSQNELCRLQWRYSNFQWLLGDLRGPLGQLWDVSWSLLWVSSIWLNSIPISIISLISFRKVATVLIQTVYGLRAVRTRLVRNSLAAHHHYGDMN